MAISARKRWNSTVLRFRPIQAGCLADSKASLFETGSRNCRFLNSHFRKRAPESGEEPRERPNVSSGKRPNAHHQTINRWMLNNKNRPIPSVLERPTLIGAAFVCWRFFARRLSVVNNLRSAPSVAARKRPFLRPVLGGNIRARCLESGLSTWLSIRHSERYRCHSLRKHRKRAEFLRRLHQAKHHPAFYSPLSATS